MFTLIGSAIAGSAQSIAGLPFNFYMNRHIASTAIVVRNYDEALAFHAGVLGFVLVEGH